MILDATQLPENYGVVKGVFEYDKDKWYPVIRTSPVRAWEWWYFTPTGEIRENCSEMKFQAMSFDEAGKARQFCLEYAAKNKGDTQ